jgi:CheY-like chemotaxis protein
LANEPLPHCDVLVVDDNADYRDGIVEVLELKGLSTYTATDGVEALRAMRERVMPTVVVLDHVMPLMDGAATAMAIRADALLRHLCLVLLTGMADVRAPHVDVVFLKPFDSAKFGNTIWRLARQRPA